MRVAAVNVIAWCWKDDQTTLPLYKQLIRYNEDYAVRCAAIIAIAWVWKNDPETLPLLQQLARSDDNFMVRHTAVQQLAHEWKNHPKIFELLCDFAINDPFYRAADWQQNSRQAALEAIIELYLDRPETLSILRDRAQNDRDQQLREFAQQKLAELEG